MLEADVATLKERQNGFEGDVTRLENALEKLTEEVTNLRLTMRGYQTFLAGLAFAFSLIGAAIGVFVTAAARYFYGSHS